MFIVSIVIGTIVSALAVLALKRYAVKKSAAETENIALVAA
jgi:hypothetical protein